MYNFTDKQKQEIINDYVNNWFSYKDIMKKYNIKSRSYLSKLLKNVVRTQSEAGVIAHKKYPEKFKLNEIAKNKIREARLKFMKEHPEQTAWRRTNISYPEKQFIKFLEERGYASKFLIEREKSVFPYFIDFAFTDLKIAVEIDGSQHLEPERKQKDIKKDKLLQNNGWTVIRIAENIVKSDWNLIEQILNNHIKSVNNNTFEQIGIIKASKTRIKEIRNINGKTIKQQLRSNYFFKKLPDKNVLLKQIKENSFVEVGKMYGVTDNAIRKWCKKLNLPYRRRDIK